MAVPSIDDAGSEVRSPMPRDVAASVAHGEALIRAQGGSMSHSPTYPDTYRLMAAQSRMLKNAYLGLTGVALVTVGAFGLAAAGPRQRTEA